MRIWLVTNLFSPDVLGGATLYTDMAQWFKARGHDVRVTTTFPYYPAWKLNPADHGFVLREDSLGDIPVRRIGMYVPDRPSGSRRIISDASFLWALLRRGKFPHWTPDAIVTAEPMLSQCAAQRFLYPRLRIPRLIIVQDFVADAAIELGLIRFPPMIMAARWLERWALGSATVLTTISPPMLAKLHQIGPKSVPKHCVPNWIHRSLAQAAKRKRLAPPARAERTLVYSGNLGVKQGLPDFVRLFVSFPHDWKLRIHGAGAAHEDLRRLIASLNDKRVVLGDILAEDDYLDLLLTATACVVTQKPGVGANFLPSKVLPCLATGTPVLAFCSRTSPLAEEVSSGGFGCMVEPDDQSGLKTALQNLADATTSSGQAYREAALAWAERYSADQVLGQLADLLQIA